MKEEKITDFSGAILGIVETKDNGDQIARLFPGRQILGYYIKSKDHTTDFYGRVLTRGNSVVALIYENLKK